MTSEEYFENCINNYKRLRNSYLTNAKVAFKLNEHARVEFYSNEAAKCQLMIEKYQKELEIL